MRFLTRLALAAVVLGAVSSTAEAGWLFGSHGGSRGGSHGGSMGSDGGSGGSFGGMGSDGGSFGGMGSGGGSYGSMGGSAGDFGSDGGASAGSRGGRGGRASHGSRGGRVRARRARGSHGSQGGSDGGSGGFASGGSAGFSSTGSSGGSGGSWGGGSSGGVSMSSGDAYGSFGSVGGAYTVQSSSRSYSSSLAVSRRPLQDSVASRPAPRPVARIVMQVPENADVYLVGKKMSLTGVKRNFVSPPLKQGAVYSYPIRVEWSENGQQHVARAEPHVRVGDSLQYEVRRNADGEYTLAQKQPAPLRSELVSLAD